MTDFTKKYTREGVVVHTCENDTYVNGFEIYLQERYNERPLCISMGDMSDELRNKNLIGKKVTLKGYLRDVAGWGYALMIQKYSIHSEEKKEGA
ncbi:MAG: hypothetical protein OXB93_02995 [Cytophagales bacterium]|nr:hypothetical protein [Cytophagales bacterium]